MMEIMDHDRFQLWIKCDNKQILSKKKLKNNKIKKKIKQKEVIAQT